MKKILFIHQNLVSFVEKDLNILREAYEVRELRFRGVRDLLKLWQGLLWCDATFAWFGKLHAFWAVMFSKILGKKIIVVAGGDDVVYEPQIRYGMFSFWWKKWCPSIVFRYADLIFSVSEFNKEETIRNAKAHPQKIKMIYHGFLKDKFRRLEGIEKEDMVITIGQISQETLIRKGLGLFIKSASFLPGIKFVLIGPDIDGTLEKVRKIAPDNVNLPERVNEDDLVKLCNKAKVYVQASIHEGFGCSIAEAMLCECIPVVSRRAAIPEVVGDCGFYVDELTPQAVANGIHKALNVDPSLGKRARERVIQHFSLERRRAELLKAVSSVVNP